MSDIMELKLSLESICFSVKNYIKKWMELRQIMCDSISTLLFENHYFFGLKIPL
jgi:hypothetical protein